MGTGYVRNDTSNNIADGNVINASDLDGEFDALQSAFNASTGHSHDGTTGEGPQITTAGLADDAVTGAKIDSTTTVTAASFVGPLTGDVTGAVTGNASTATALQTARTIAGQSFNGTANISIAPTDLTGVTSTAAEINTLDGFTGDVNDLNYAKDLRATGVTTTEFDKLDGLTATTTELNYNDITTLGTVEASKTVTADGSGNINFNSGNMTNVDIDSGTIDATTIGSGTPSTGAFTTLSASSTFTLGGTAITATGAEINYVDGVTSNIQTQLDAKGTGTVSSLSDLSITASAAEINKLDTMTTSTAELNIMDGDTTATSTTLVDADRVVVNDNGTMVQVAMTDVQTYVNANLDADILKADVADTITAPMRGTVTADNDLSFDMNATNNFKCTPTGNGTLTFTNITSGQSGNIWLDNSGGHTISAAASTYISSADLTTISAAGVYFLSYYSDGTNVMVSATPAVTSAGA